MKKFLLVLIVLSAIALPGVVSADQSYYVCGCGPDCNCGAISDQPGKCGCNKDMVQMHLLSIEGDTAAFCTCGGDCKCKLSADDPSKCGCEKPVKKVSLKGKYVCSCGPDCKCGAISDKPGNCGCGKPMKQM